MDYEQNVENVHLWYLHTMMFENNIINYLINNTSLCDHMWNLNLLNEI